MQNILSKAIFTYSQSLIYKIPNYLRANSVSVTEPNDRTTFISTWKVKEADVMTT